MCCVLSDHSLQPHGLQPTRLLCPWGFCRQEVGRRAFLQGIFPIQGLNPDLLQLQADSLLTEPPGKPKNTGVGSLSFSKGSSDPAIEPISPTSQVDSLPAEPPGEPLYLFELVFLFPLDEYSEVELLNHVVVLFLIF